MNRQTVKEKVHNTSVTIGKLHKQPGRWGKRRLRRMKKDNMFNERHVLNLFFHESAQSIYTSWKWVDKNDEALHLPNHLLLGSTKRRLRALSVLEGKRGADLIDSSFDTTEWYIVRTTTGSNKLPKDEVQPIPLNPLLKRRMAMYLKQPIFNEKFCCYDLVAYLHGVLRDTPEWETFLPGLTIVRETDAIPGDVVAYVKNGTRDPVHVGIYLGNNLVMSRNGINDCLLINTVEDMRVFYDFHGNCDKPLEVIYGRAKNINQQ